MRTVRDAVKRTLSEQLQRLHDIDKNEINLLSTRARIANNMISKDEKQAQRT
jgi:hypothetical protein